MLALERFRLLRIFRHERDGRLRLVSKRKATDRRQVSRIGLRLCLLARVLRNLALSVQHLDADLLALQIELIALGDLLGKVGDERRPAAEDGAGVKYRHQNISELLAIIFSMAQLDRKSVV